MHLQPECRFEKRHIVQMISSDVSFTLTFLICISCQFKVQGGCDCRGNIKDFISRFWPQSVKSQLDLQQRNSDPTAGLWPVRASVHSSARRGLCFLEEVVNIKICVYEAHDTVDSTSTYTLQCFECHQSCKNVGLGCFVTGTTPKVVLRVIIVIIKNKIHSVLLLLTNHCLFAHSQFSHFF